VRLSPYPGTVSRRCFLSDARHLPRAPSPKAGVTYLQGDLEGHLGEHYPSFKAHTGSCAGPRPSHLPRFPSVGGSLQVVASPCWELALPGVISENLSLDAWTCTPVLPLVHLPVSSQRASAFAMSEVARQITGYPYSDFCTGGLTGLQSFDDLQASRFARHSGRSHHRRPFVPRGSRGFYVRAEYGLLPPRTSDMLAVRIGQLTAWGLSPH